MPAQAPPNPFVELRAAYRSLFSTGEGQRVLADLRVKYGDRPSYVQGDPHQTTYHEGQRSVVTYVARMLVEVEAQEAITR